MQLECSEQEESDAGSGRGGLAFLAPGRLGERLSISLSVQGKLFGVLLFHPKATFRSQEGTMIYLIFLT